AFLGWLLFRPGRIIWPSYTLPLCAFMATTVISLAMSPQPELGMASVRKFVLFVMAFLAANFVSTTSRARLSYRVLLAMSAGASILALVQFTNAYIRFRTTHDLADDPTVLTRMTGFMGHWITFRAEHLLVWCAAILTLQSPISSTGTWRIISFKSGPSGACCAWLPSFGLFLNFMPVWSPCSGRQAKAHDGSSSRRWRP